MSRFALSRRLLNASLALIFKLYLGSVGPGEIHAYIQFEDDEQVTECSAVLIDWGDESRSQEVACPPDFHRYHKYKSTGIKEVIAMVTYITKNGHKSPYVTGKIAVK